MHRGAILLAGSFARTVGSMAHEFGHGLGLFDLYDQDYDGPEEDSAGIGRWGLMGWGAHGWNGDDGPNPLCAWSREQLGWLGPDNARLAELQEDAEGLEIASLQAGGRVVKLPLRSGVLAGQFVDEEYLLLEYRSRSACYYDRHLPASGLLIWRVRPNVRLIYGLNHNDREEAKTVDLICADGLDAVADDLDRWAHDAVYCRRYGGNLGDAGDPFDGVRYTSCIPDPASAPGAAVRRIRSRPGAVLVDATLPRWSGILEGEVHWTGEVVVDGDLTIAPQGRLVLHDPVRVRFADRDRLAAGLDPRRCELQVQGELSVQSGVLFYLDRAGQLRRMAKAGVVLEPQEAGGDWYGVLLEAPAVEQLESLEERISLRGAAVGVVAGGRGLHTGVDGPTAVTGMAMATPAAFRLLPNHPNPFNGETAIPYALSGPAHVRLEVYDALGQRVCLLLDRFQEAGRYQVAWEGRGGGWSVAGQRSVHLPATGRRSLRREPADGPDPLGRSEFFLVKGIGGRYLHSNRI